MEKQKKIYVGGLSLKKPHPNAPDFVRFKGDINLPKLRVFEGAKGGRQH